MFSYHNLSLILNNWLMSWQVIKSLWPIFILFYFKKIFILFLNFTILYRFCQISKWIRHRYTCVPHPEASSLLLPIPSLWVVPVHQPQASSIVHRTWTGDSFHIWYYTYFNAILPSHPTVIVKGCCCSVAQSCPTLCNPMDCSMPDFHILHCLLEFAQIYVHWVGDAI